jgi:hypothetical protein
MVSDTQQQGFSSDTTLAAAAVQYTDHDAQLKDEANRCTRRAETHAYVRGRGKTLSTCLL